MKLTCYRAMCGDAFHLQFVGESGKCRHIFLDMGHPKTYTDVLKRVIKDIVASSEKVDALFLSHIHDDHIGGVKRFIKDARSDSLLKEAVGWWIYNAPRRYAIDKTNPDCKGVKCGIVSGDRVYEYIQANRPENLNDVIAGQTFSIDGMQVTILSPDELRLNQLRDKYSNDRPLCKSETDEVSVEAGNVTDDYSVPLNEFRLDGFLEDGNIENASSIAAIFEMCGKRIMWLSDSVPSVIIESLSQLGYSEKNKLHCDVVLLSHHGSSANNSVDMFRMVSSNRYVISADGINRHCLPDKETVARILLASSELPISVYFNYRDGRLARMFDSDDAKKLKLMIDAHYLSDKESIEI